MALRFDLIRKDKYKIISHMPTEHSKGNFNIYQGTRQTLEHSAQIE